LRGSGFGLLATVQGIGDFLSSIVVGVLWSVHPQYAMTFVIVTALVGACVVATLPKDSSATDKQSDAH
jgi:uncharacterized membrane protein YeaQ/YmgE (transglycosylase-associated protein family)